MERIVTAANIASGRLFFAQNEEKLYLVENTDEVYEHPKHGKLQSANVLAALLKVSGEFKLVCPLSACDMFEAEERLRDKLKELRQSVWQRAADMSANKKKVRQEFRDACFERDGNACACCGAKPPAGVKIEDFLDAHHITDRNDMPNGGYVAANGISLCKAVCHPKAEIWHSSGKTKSEEGFKPEDLYSKIGSSYNEAVEASKKLAAEKEKK